MQTNKTETRCATYCFGMRIIRHTHFETHIDLGLDGLENFNNFVAIFGQILDKFVIALHFGGKFSITSSSENVRISQRGRILSGVSLSTF